MRAGGVAADIKPARIGAEARRIRINPGNRAPHLIGDRHKVATGRDHVVEVQRGEIRASGDERFGRKRIIRGLALTPGAAMDEHADRRICNRRGIEIEPLDRRTAIGKTPRFAEATARRNAVRGIAPDDLRLVGRVFDLVVGVVELRLVHVEKDSRTFLPNRMVLRFRGGRHCFFCRLRHRTASFCS
jgi:hypothetical protein